MIFPSRSGLSTIAVKDVVARREEICFAALPTPPNSSALFRALLSSRGSQIYVIDSGGVLIWSNLAAHDPFARCRMPSLGESLGETWLCVSTTSFARSVAKAAKCGNASLVGSANNAYGASREWEIQIIRLDDDLLREGQFAVVANDITPLLELRSARRSAVTVSGLAGFARRNTFYDRLDSLITADDQVPFSLVMIDIDRFRVVNEEMGRKIGDKVLLNFARRLERYVGPGDVAARLGGDEFGIVVCDRDGEDRAGALMEKLRLPIRVPGGRDCSVSAGLARYPDEGNSISQICGNAEAALYEAKSLGEGNMRRFDGSLREAEHARRAMVSRADFALNNDAIVAYYQPKIDLALGTIVGFEALLRWRSSANTMELPSTIWAAFADPHLSRRITEAMLDRIIADLVCWQRLGILVPVAINVSDADLRDSDFADRLLKRLSDAGLSTSSIEVEITETVFLDRASDHLLDMLKKLHDAQIRIALDDFGTGHASLSHLKKLPVDVIKIDRSFTANLRSDPGDRAIVEAMLAMAQKLAIEVVAEGVEHEYDVQFLRTRGCQMSQGYLFSPAVPAGEVPALLARPSFAFSLHGNSNRG